MAIEKTVDKHTFDENFPVDLTVSNQQQQDQLLNAKSMGIC